MTTHSARAAGSAGRCPCCGPAGACLRCLVWNNKLRRLIACRLEAMGVGWYFFWFLLIPLVSGCVLIRMCGSEGTRFVFENLPWPVQAVLMILGVPMLVNICFGPSIYAFWKVKKSRVWILVLNVLCLFGGWAPGLWLWIWALLGAVKRTPARPLIAVTAAQEAELL
jgi:hypothetical protein